MNNEEKRDTAIAFLLQAYMVLDVYPRIADLEREIDNIKAIYGV